MRAVLFSLLHLALLLGLSSALQAADNELLYTVKPGDHLHSVARSYLIDGATPDNIRLLGDLNKLRNRNYIAPGSVLRIPLDRLKMIAGEARVADHYGDAQIDGRPATNGAVVGPDRPIRTGNSGGVLVELSDGSRLWVRNNSEVRLTPMRRAPDLDYSETGVNVSGGRIEVLVNKLRGNSRFEIRSPTATLGVRGTDFRVGASAESSHTEVLEGLVAAGGANSSELGTQVAAGFGTVVDGSGVPTPPVKLLEAPVLGGLPALQERPLVRFTLPPTVGATAYRGQVADATSQHFVASQVATGPELRFTDIPDGQYQLLVRAIDAGGLEGLDARHTFTLKARPEPPLPSSPPPGFRARGEAVQLAWTIAADAQAYRLQIAPDATFRTVTVDRNEEPGTTVDLKLPPGEYFWRIAAIDAKKSQGPFGDPRKFELRPLPGAPAEPKITDGQAVFSWPSEPGQTFEVDVARDDKFTQIVRSIRTDAASTTIDVTDAGQYYTRVRATDPDGFVGPYSATQRFDIPPKPLPAWLLIIPWLILLLL